MNRVLSEYVTTASQIVPTTQDHVCKQPFNEAENDAVLRSSGAAHCENSTKALNSVLPVFNIG